MSISMQNAFAADNAVVDQNGCPVTYPDQEEAEIPTVDTTATEEPAQEQQVPEQQDINDILFS